MRNNVTSIWTEQRVIDLRQLLSSGLTYSEIGDKIGVTRSAIGGKINRLGLTVRPNRGHTKRSPEEIEITKRLKNERRKARRRALCFMSGPTLRRRRPPLPTVCEEIEPRHLTFFELESHHCRWPYGNKPYTFCGLDKYDGHPSYCPSHCLANMRSANRD